MHLDQKEIEELVFKFHNGSITRDELKVLIDWYNSHDDQDVRIPGNLSREQVKDRMLGNLLDKVHADTNTAPSPRKGFGFPYRWLVAALVLIVGAGLWILLNQKSSSGPQLSEHSVIEPGGNKATLTLSDGQKIHLNTGQSGIVVGETISYSDGTKLTQIDPDSDPSRLLTLHTPRGGIYQITLSDGTRVWLNSASSLRYPVQFSSDERVVEVQGEAYFEVETQLDADGNKIPFRVRSAQQEVVVLGTEFNISAYPEQPCTQTTLIEGKVLVKVEKETLTLHPGEQATTDADETLVQTVETPHATAWKAGKFSFDGKTFQDIMKEIERWYDLDIVYENEIPQEEIVGDAFRNQDLTLVLRLLDAVSIDYVLDVDQRKLIIKGKKQIGN